eukprot:GHVR01069994.1.p1 GENE.GHVR01069994.1~~GHVR01069994.1.p1  ORF type:complete len:114 (-),score=3.43 GHVR01069994.1:1846-2187(-)
MNKTIRKNLRIRLGDIVQIRAAGDVPNLTKVHVLPLEDTIEGLTGDLTKTFLIPYFKDAYRPVKKGDLFVVRGISNQFNSKLSKLNLNSMVLLLQALCYTLKETLSIDKMNKN